MVIFHSYVKLPEGNPFWSCEVHGKNAPCVFSSRMNSSYGSPSMPWMCRGRGGWLVSLVLSWRESRARKKILMGYNTKMRYLYTIFIYYIYIYYIHYIHTLYIYIYNIYIYIHIYDIYIYIISNILMFANDGEMRGWWMEKPRMEYHWNIGINAME